MAIRNFAKLALAALAVAACQVQEPFETQAPETTEPVVSEYIPGKVIVEFSDDMIALIEEDLNAGSVQTKSAGLNQVLENLGITSLERVFPYAGVYEGRTRRSGLHRFYRVTFSADIPVTKASGDLSSVPGIVSATPSHKIYRRSVGFNDPLFSKQWHYINKSTAGADVNVESVWENYTKGSEDVIVCVLDEPVDATHEDLMANLWRDGEGHTGYNFCRNSWDLSIRPEGGYYQGEYLNGDCGHGTHVAGTIAAVNNNGVGLCGIAGGDAQNGIPGVRIQSCAIFSGYNAYADDEACAAAMKWGADHGAVISQNSWGPTYESKPIDEYDPMMKAAIDYFIEQAGCDDNLNQLPDSPMKGGLVLFAAGNETFDYDPYGAYEPVIAVGAFNEKGNRASYSNYGSWVDVAAPGAGNATTESNSIWSTVPLKVNDYGDHGGSVITTTGYEGTGWRGTSMACPHVSGVAALIVSYFGKQGFTADDAKKILFGGLGATIGGSKPIGKKIDAAASFQWALDNGYTPGSDPEGPQPPSIKFSQNPVNVAAHETQVITVTVKDANKDAFTVEYTAGSAAETWETGASEGVYKLTIVGRNAKAGAYKAKVKATDETGLSNEVEFVYEILANHAPKVRKTPSNQMVLTLQSESSPIDLAACFADEDAGDVLTYEVSADYSAFINKKINGGKLYLTASSFGSACITLTATDVCGASVSTSFQFTAMSAEQSVLAYPQVARNDAYILLGTTQPTEVKVSLYNSLGGLVLQEVLFAGLYQPIHLDLSKVAPGRYTAVIEGWGETRKVPIVKY